MHELNSFLKEVIEHYTPVHQLDIAIEEMSELTKEICKYKRGFDNRESIIEEIADVIIMMEQLRVIFDVEDDDLKKYIDFKFKRLIENMEIEE